MQRSVYLSYLSNTLSGCPASREHYTDTAGFTDHVFGLMHFLGFRFAPRIRDLGETKLYRCTFPTATSTTPRSRR